MKFIPTKEYIESLKEGDKVTNCFGKEVKITRIYGRGYDLRGRAFICFYAEFGNSEMSDSFKEGQVWKTVGES